MYRFSTRSHCPAYGNRRAGARARRRRACSRRPAGSTSPPPAAPPRHAPCVSPDHVRAFLSAAAGWSVSAPRGAGAPAALSRGRRRSAPRRAHRRPRVISDCHAAVHLNHFIPGFLSYSVAVFLKWQSDLSPRRPRGRRGGSDRPAPPPSGTAPILRGARGSAACVSGRLHTGIARTIATSG
jgi:hypothetical protein